MQIVWATNYLKSRVALFVFTLCVFCACVQANEINLAVGATRVDVSKAPTNRGFSAVVNSMEYLDNYNGVASGEKGQWVALSVTISNNIDPELVFDAGVDEAVVLFAQPIHGPYLLWNSNGLATIDGRLPVQSNTLDDPLSLPYFDDSATGTLVYRVPQTEALSHASLLFTHDVFGELLVPIATPAEPLVPVNLLGDGWEENSALSVRLSDIVIDTDVVNVTLSVSGGRVVDSPALEPDTIIPANLSGLRLLVPGEKPIAPDYVPADSAVQSFLPIVAVPGRVINYTLTFNTSLANARPDVALVLPVAPPHSQAGEPYWSVVLRGELPSLSGLGLQLEAGATKPRKDVGNPPLSDKPASGTELDKSIVVHAPSWPDKPSVPRSEAQLKAELSAQKKAHASRTDITTITPATVLADAIDITQNGAIEAGFEGKKRVHYFRLPAVQSDELANVLVTTNAAKPLILELLYQTENGDWKRAMQRASDEGLQQLKLDTPYILSIHDRSASSRYSLGIYTSNILAVDESFEPSDTSGLPDMVTQIRRSTETELEWFGRFDTSRDVDYFRIEVTEPALATIEISPPAKIAIHNDNGEVGQSKIVDNRSFLADVLVPTGTSFFSVTAKRNSEPVNYTIKTTFYPLPAPTHELEPNDAAPQGHRLIPGIARSGRLPTLKDRDWYFFDWPGQATAQITTTNAHNDAYKLELLSGTKVYPLSKVDDISMTADLPAGHYALNISGKTQSLKPYQLMLDYAPLDEGENSDSFPVSMALKANKAELKSYAEFPQAINTSLELFNPGSEVRTIELSSKSANDCCRIIFDQNTIELAAGQSQQVGVTLQSKRDSASEAPFPVDITARIADKQMMLRWMVNFSDTALPHYAQWPDYPIPSSMMGAWDLARTDFGAHPADSISVKNSKELLSGLPIITRIASGKQFTVALAVESTLSGFLLDTRGTGTLQVKDVALSISSDNKAFTEVSRISLSESKGITAVELPDHPSAKYVRVDLLRGFPPFEKSDKLRLGGIKVLAKNDANPVFKGGVNLAQKHLGFEYYAQTKAELVVAFHHKRQAEISSISLRNEGRETVQASIAASVEGPYGPWRSLGSIAIEPQAKNTLALALPIPARYLSVGVSGKSTTVDHRKIQFVSVQERPSVDGYRSILTEWGSEDSAAGFEWFEKKPPLATTYFESSALKPVAAKIGSRFDSEVSLRNEREDFYRVSMPPVGEELQLTFNGDPFFRARIEVRTPEGELIPHDAQSVAGRQSVQMTIPSTDQYQYVLVRVHDTPRHLAVLWDDSGSVASFIPGILKLVRNMAFSLDSKWERLQLTPLHQKDDGFLTNDWTADPYEIAGAIRRYRTSGSSNAYLTLDHVLDELSKVDGMRAVLILTDERSDRSKYPNNAIEKKLAAVAPTTFSFHMSAGVALHDEQINHMQSWASITGGRYTMLQSPDEIPRSFAKVQGWLRKPARYHFEVSSVKTVPSQTILGQLRVSATENQDKTTSGLSGAVEVIFDASGSMWSKLADGSPRIVVARQVLTDLVSNTLPDDTPFALRVFGHRESRSCRTDLELPVGALNKSKTLQKINGINPQNRSKTPIAASLAAVEQDLKGVSGQRLVLLITDGEETCDGDPKAAINKLVAAGFDVQVNIVGFAIDDESLKRDFREWASLGGGDYFDAGNAEQLGKSLAESLRPRFIVLNSSGAQVGAGRVGEGTPVDLPSGVYSVILGKSKRQEGVLIKSGELTELHVGD